jgi:hypothetical protein
LRREVPEFIEMLLRTSETVERKNVMKMLMMVLLFHGRFDNLIEYLSTRTSMR